MTLSATEREAHIRELAVEHHFSLELKAVDHSGRIFGYAETVLFNGSRRVTVGWRGDAQSYLVALHEAGHFAVGHHPDLEQNYWPRIVEAEAEAWDWALSEAREPIERGLQRVIAEAMLGSYVRDYGLTTASVAYASVSSRIGGIQITQRQPE